jgi:class 3 adenylate cyclase/tetratricopeptide (TPR) repeat protein
MRLTCPSCGERNREKARYCDQCGGQLLATEVDARSSTKLAERRQISVVFFDLVNSTELAARLDPEDLRDLMTGYRTAVAGSVAKFGGSVAQYLGDGVLAYFGYPHADEADAESAIRASLDSLAQVSVLKNASGALATRIGIATGLVVAGNQVGAESSLELLAVGETPQLAARLQALAQPNEIVVSAQTHKLTNGLFEFRALGAQSLKGIEAPVECYLVAGANRSEDRFESQRLARTSPFLGREPEMRKLRELWQKTCAGSGQFVTVTSEPGIGKSRLMHELSGEVAASGHRVMRCVSSPYHRGTVLFPFARMISNAAALATGDAESVRAEKIAARFDTIETLDKAKRSAIQDLLGLTPDAPSLIPQDPHQRRAQMLDAIAAYVGAENGPLPTLFIFEDAHWSDPTSIAMIDRLCRATASAPLLLVVTYRPEFQNAWNTGENATSIQLDRLDDGQANRLVRSVPGAERLEKSKVDEIIRRAGGVPLFVEEVTRAALENVDIPEASGSNNADNASPIPQTLLASLVARFDRLGEGKDVAQIAAVIGKDVSHDLLAAVVGGARVKLSTGLAKLFESGLLFEERDGAQRVYAFKHALVRDAAYQTLLKSRRRELHQKTAEILDDRFLETARGQPEVLAYHYAEGRVPAKAVSYWLAAGQIAAARSASAEASSHAAKGLELIAGLPADQSRDRNELALQCILGPALVDIAGHSADKTVKAFERAKTLMEATGDTTRRDEVLTGLTNTYNNRAEYRKSMALREEMLRLAEASGDATSLCAAHRGIASLHNIFGNFELAKKHGEIALGLYDEATHSPLAWRFVHDLGVSTESQLAITLWHLGEFERSRALSASAIERANRLGHANSIGYALAHEGYMAAFLRFDLKGLEQGAKGLLAIKDARGSLPWEMWGRYMQFFAFARSGVSDKALAAMTEGLSVRDRMKNRAAGSTVTLMAAEVFLRSGQHSRALEAIESCILLSDTTGEKWMLAEVFRVKADTVLAMDAAASEGAALAALEQSVETARRQGSRAFELRASLSLAKLLHAKGRGEEACTQLSEVVARFPADVVTEDLNRARGFLAASRPLPNRPAPGAVA